MKTYKFIKRPFYSVKKITMSKSKVAVNTLNLDESSLSWKIFEAFLSDSQLSLTEEELRNFAYNELNFPRSKLTCSLAKHFPSVLVLFMNVWSGWHFKDDYKAGKFKKQYYFQRFCKFMRHKVNSTLRNNFITAEKSVRDSTEELSSQESEFAPYCISVRCPARTVNTIVFSNEGDDVIMKQHLGKPIEELTVSQLLNWPYIQLSFSTEDIFFTRRQATDFVRYLNFFPHDSNNQNKNIIESAEVLGSRECFSLDYIEKYFKVYLDALKTSPDLDQSLLYEIQTIIVQFLEDIKYININKSIATSTKILFSMCPAPFVRNKKLMKSSDKYDDTRIGYCEIITPKTELLLSYFKPKQLDSLELAFEYTEKIKQSQDLPRISYRCTFCNIEFQTTKARKFIMRHIKLEHKMEQYVRCTYCKKQFDVLNLAGCRWKHKCALITPNSNK